MKRIKQIALWTLLAVVMGAPSVSHAVTNDREGRILGGTSAGFGIFGSEGAFITDLEADYFLDDHFSVGYEMLFGLGGFFVWGNQVVGKYTLDFHEDNWLRDFKPYGELLLGVVVVSDSGDSEAGVLGGFGFGGDYFFDPRWGAGTNMMFQFSNDVGGTSFAWIWKMVELKYLF